MDAKNMTVSHDAAGKSFNYERNRGYFPFNTPQYLCELLFCELEQVKYQCKRRDEEERMKDKKTGKVVAGK